MAESEARILPIRSEDDRRQWDKLASRSAMGHMHQCFWWAEPLAQFNVSTHALGCWNGARLVGGALFRSVPVPFLGMRVTECLDGPIFVEWRSGWADGFVRAVRHLGEEANSIVVVVRGCQNNEVHRDLLQAFERADLKTSLARGDLEGILSLTGRTMEGLRKSFRKGTKWSVKKGLTGPVRVARLTSDEQLRGAYDAWKATARRKGFLDVRPWSALQPVLRHCVDNALGSVLGTLLEERVLAAAFVTFIGKTASWIYGGYVDGSESYHPTHVLQQAAIQECLDRGMNAYSFGGLVSDGESRRSGVDEFKLGFGALPRRNLDTITWERRPSWNQCLQWFRRQKLGRRVEKLLKKEFVRRAER